MIMIACRSNAACYCRVPNSHAPSATTNHYSPITARKPFTACKPFTARKSISATK